MRMSDIIETFIKDMLKEDQEYIEIQRNELAEYFNCVPSQINYVISTRFSPEHGYYVESRRGGGGYIRIKKINTTRNEYIMNLIKSIKQRVSSHETDIYISTLLSEEYITVVEAKLLKVATSDNVLNLPQEYKDSVRASLFKNMLINLVEE